jgi:hypothetical protein
VTLKMSHVCTYVFNKKIVHERVRVCVFPQPDRLGENTTYICTSCRLSPTSTLVCMYVLDHCHIQTCKQPCM